MDEYTIRAELMDANMRGVTAPWHAGYRMLLRIIDSERDARDKASNALRKKDEAMGVLFDRLNKAGVDCSDLFS